MTFLLEVVYFFLCLDPAQRFGRDDDRDVLIDFEREQVDIVCDDEIGLLNSVGGAIDSLKKELGNESLSDSARAAVNKTMSQLSKYKDAVEEYLRR